MSEVKPGQVWESKNMGRRIQTVEKDTVRGHPWWKCRVESSTATVEIYEWMLLEDYVLVKEATK